LDILATETMGMKYEVKVTEQIEHWFDVEADSPEQAAERADLLFNKGVEKKDLPYSDYDHWINPEDIHEC
jgi:hypothetical protein